MSDSLTIDELMKVIDDMDQLMPEYNHIAIDEWIDKGNKIENTVLITSKEGMQGINKLRTKHGLLKVTYNKYVPYNTDYIMNDHDGLYNE